MFKYQASSKAFECVVEAIPQPVRIGGVKTAWLVSLTCVRPRPVDTNAAPIWGARVVHFCYPLICFLLPKLKQYDSVLSSNHANSRFGFSLGRFSFNFSPLRFQFWMSLNCVTVNQLMQLNQPLRFQFKPAVLVSID